MRTEESQISGDADVRWSELNASFRRVWKRLGAGASWSGQERNHLFLNRRGEQFTDISGVSGLDDIADSRAFAILDYDRDGWQDIALVNANAPLFELFRNQIGSSFANGTDGGHMLAFRFVGGNHTAKPTESLSTRDGYGAMVTVELSDLTLRREHRAGEGFAAQNSATMVIGIGKHSEARSVTVRWPSGRIQQTSNVPANMLVTVYEDPAHSPSGKPFVFQPYKLPSSSPTADTPSFRRTAKARLLLHSGDGHGEEARLRLYTMMATWCLACKKELPHLQDLRTSFSPKELAMFGVPLDRSEDAKKLTAWAASNRPAYELLLDLTPEQVESVKTLMMAELGAEAIPATIVTDAAGNVLLTQWGPPTISQLRELQWQMQYAE